jgi:hypothetical protein
MGSAFFIELEKEISGLDSSTDGKALARAEGYLSALCEDIGVTPLIQFVVVPKEQLDEFLVAEGLDDLHLDTAKIEAVWFQPAAGLATVRALLGSLEKDPESFTDFAEVEASWVSEDLRETERVLQEAESAGVRWRFLVDY